jgi:hypothetical protein
MIALGRRPAPIEGWRGFGLKGSQDTFATSTNTPRPRRAQAELSPPCTSDVAVTRYSRVRRPGLEAAVASLASAGAR